MMHPNITLSKALWARCCPHRTLVARYVLSGLVLLTSPHLGLTANHDCTREHMAINQGLITRLPADPRVTHAVLQMQHEGAALCRQGAIDAGRARLRAAAERLDLNTHRVTPPQR